jgi:1-acyl-sn-glycerol-3-phosphate acyltransferase
MGRQETKTEYLDKYRYPRHQFRRGFLRSGIALLVKILVDYQIYGKENLPKKGPLLIVGNHFHFLDTIGPIHSTKYPLEFIGDAEMPNAPMSMKLFPRIWDTLRIMQGAPNLAAMRAAEAVLEQDGILGIFPEGHVHQPPLGTPLPGAAFLALRLGVPILPIGTFSEDDWKIFGTLRDKRRKACVVTRIGKPFGPLVIGEPGKLPGRVEVKAAGQAIMEKIAALLPISARGPYTAELS